MSGGVDSSVAAALLKKEGYEVIGAHMRCYNVDGCAEQDAEDARRAAEVLDIPFYVFDFEQEYKKKVVDYMISGYKNGTTPNPDVMCNKEIKFGLFFKKAMEMGADYVATGHYVRREFRILNLGFRKNVKKSSLNSKSYILYSARDKNKDQSYFLWTLTQNQLKHCLFPIGEYKKPRVRELAAKFGLFNAAKKDSQGICFLGQVSLPDFLKKYIKPKKGSVVVASPASGAKQSYKIIGEHRGAHFYTIGQRHGLASGNWHRASSNGNSSPFYVVDKNVDKNIVVVAEGNSHPALYKKEIELADVNLINPKLGNSRFVSLREISRRETIRALPIFARVRYRQPLERAMLNVKCGKTKKGIRHINHSLCRVSLKFYHPVKFVAPGQSAVFYDAKGVMLGGGIIKSAS